MTEPYAYQVWLCSRCEDGGSVVHDSTLDYDLRCEECGALFTADGEHVPDPEEYVPRVITVTPTGGVL